GLARAGRDERAGALELDDADATDVHRRQRVAVAERRRVDLRAPTRIEDRRALLDPHGASVDGQLDHASTPRFSTADATALAAVCPRPQMDASFITCARSARTARSFPFVLPDASRCSASSWRTVPTRQGTHCPQDSSRKNS